MINIRDWESRRTHQAWGTGSGNPALMILTCLVINIIALIVAIVICAFVIEDGSNDLSYGTGWSVFIPAPAAGIIWTLIDVALCRYSVLHPIYYLVESIWLFMLTFSCALTGILMYSWSQGASWLPAARLPPVAATFTLW
ncbi:hypothetical protein Q7P36_004178 [Cladosporium allicinum]